MKIEWINQHKQIKELEKVGITTPYDFDYLTIHQEWSVERDYLSFYLIILGFGVEILI